MRTMALLFAAIVVLSPGPVLAQQGQDPMRVCNVDADCRKTGCSGQLCANQAIITTCEFRCEYGCYAAAACLCVGHRCAFADNGDLHQCLRTCRQNAAHRQIELLPTDWTPPTACDAAVERLFTSAGQQL